MKAVEDKKLTSIEKEREREIYRKEKRKEKKRNEKKNVKINLSAIGTTFGLPQQPQHPVHGPPPQQ